MINKRLMQLLTVCTAAKHSHSLIKGHFQTGLKPGHGINDGHQVWSLLAGHLLQLHDEIQIVLNNHEVSLVLFYFVKK